VSDAGTARFARAYHLLSAAEAKVDKNSRDNLAERYELGAIEEVHELAEQICSARPSLSHRFWDELFDVFGYVELIVRAKPNSSAMRLLQAKLMVAIDMWVARKVERGQNRDLATTITFLLALKRAIGRVG